MARLLLDLPAEVLHQISNDLPNRDIKNLRRTCSFANIVFRLRFNRVFLSPHQRDIDVFCQVACSETFRHQIVELVWDQSRFCLGKMASWLFLDPFTPFESSNQLATEMVRFRRNRIANAGCLISDDLTDFGGINMPNSRIAKINKAIQILREANERSNNDYFALEYYINRFPSLRRITISHSTNGWLFEPFYETPMVRSLPSHFIYDVERSDSAFDYLLPLEFDGWTDWSLYSMSTRGYTAIFKTLAAATELQLEEIIMETPSGVDGGLPFCFFTLGRTSDYLNLVELLRRPHLRRFDLGLTIWQSMPDYENRPHPPTKLLKDALGEATSLTHFSLKMELYPHRPIDCTPLKTLLPMNRWTNLRHFELAYFTVRQNDLANLLGELPQSIRSIELGFLVFFEDSGSFAGLLDEIRERAFWNGRDEMDRPRLGISLRVGKRASRSIAIRVDAEVESFLYKQGMNPFRGSRGPSDVELGIGTERDTFNQCEWPRDQDFHWQEEIDDAHKRLQSMSNRSEKEFDHISSMMEKMPADVDELSGDEFDWW